MEITFKTDRQEQEWNSSELDPRLRAIVLAVAEYMARNYDHGTVITSIWRTPEEHIAIYKNRTDGPKASPHMFWRAIDIRSRNYRPGEIDALIGFLNTWWPRGDKYSLVIYHDVGRGAHLHIQVPYKVRPI